MRTMSSSPGRSIISQPSGRASTMSVPLRTIPPCSLNSGVSPWRCHPIAGTTCRVRVNLTTSPSESTQYPSRSPVAVAGHQLLLPTNMPGISGSRSLASPTALETHPEAVHPPSTTQSISPRSLLRPPYASRADGATSPILGRHMPSTIDHCALLGSKPCDAASAVWPPPGYPPPATEALSPGPTVEGGGPVTDDSARAAPADSITLTLLFFAHSVRRSM